jgi:hypothetical protein
LDRTPAADDETKALADVQAAEISAEPGAVERNTAFKARVAGLSPAGRSRVHATVAARYASYADPDGTVA